MAKLNKKQKEELMLLTADIKVVEDSIVEHTLNNTNSANNTSKMLIRVYNEILSELKLNLAKLTN
jgi:hypothetical protein